MKIFLTGGTGFIGSHLLNDLTIDGFHVIAHRRGKQSKTKIKIKQKINWIECSLDDIDVNFFKDIDIIIHLASHSVQYPFDGLMPCIKNNVHIPLKLFQNALNGGVKKFVIAGSCVEYGLSGENYEYIPVDAPLNPANTYATSKAMSYYAFKELFSETNALVHYHRIFHVFGEGQQSDRLWPFLKNCAVKNKDVDLTLGEQVFDFINVGEVSSKFIKSAKICSKSNSNGFFVYNMGSGNPITIKEFAEFWWKKWNAKGNLNFGKKKYRDKEIMRYVPQVSDPVE
tara:strand:- start:3722 stop:4573 length:852 start_codon:yes stop_codon:yes gene_type:complete